VAIEPDTNIGGAKDRFPVTNHSAIVAVRSGDEGVRRSAFERIVRSYWKPAYKYVRIKWRASNEDAKDFTQGFFSAAFEKNYFAHYDAGKASFQTFLRTCLDRYIANQRKSQQRLKRGGGYSAVSFDFSEAESELVLQTFPSEASPDDFFYRECVRCLLAESLKGLRAHYQRSGKDIYFQLFQLYDLGDSATISYASLADQFGLTTADVTNYLAAARREFRKLVVTKLRELSASDESFRSEAKSLLGIKIQ